MPDAASPLPFRRTARVLCVDDDRVLLMRTHWYRRLDEPRWLTPGGGIEEGESEREAAARELFEETGQRVPDDELVGPVWHSRQPHPPGHSHAASDATYFVWRTRAFEASREHWMPDEVDDILDVRWWSRDEIAASDEVFSDEDVAAMLARLAPSSPRAGDRVRVAGTKWHGGPHWRYEAVVLGDDEHGVWIGAPAGTLATKGDRRPERMGHGFVRLVPTRADSWLEGTWALPGRWDGDPELLAYVDVSTPPSIREDGDGWVVEYVDLDLDLVVPYEGEPWLDDEDEFAERSAQDGWPGWVVERTRTSGDALLTQARTGTLPWLDAADRWTRALAERSGPIDSAETAPNGQGARGA